MGSLRSQDLRDVVDVSHRALACERLSDLQHEVLRSMERAIGARSSVYADVTLGGQSPVSVTKGKERGVSEDAMIKWCAGYHHQDPLMQKYLTGLGASSRNVIVSSEVIRRRDYLANSFYNEFLKPQSIYHVMLIGLKPPGRPTFAIVGLHRSESERAFSRQEVAKADLMAPGLRGAVERIQAREQLRRLGGEIRGDTALETVDDEALLAQRMHSFGLSRREKDVVALLKQGLTSMQIADKLHISVRTVNNHLRSVYEKTGVHNRTALLYELTR